MNDKWLIDANALKQRIIQDYRRQFFGSVLWNILDDMPAINAVEVVRCRVCIHRVRTNSTLGFSWCGKFGNVMRDADFCSWGERKMDGGAE